MAWLDPNWTYRKQVTISSSSGAGTNYPVKLLIGASVSASGDDFHLEGNSLNFPAGFDDGGDLRFTASDEVTELDFWVEKVEGTGASAVATVWVEVAADLSSANQNVYCYYANASATNSSNGGNTFQFYDDFEDGTLNNFNIPSTNRGFNSSTVNPRTGTRHARVDTTMTRDAYPTMEILSLAKVEYIEVWVKEAVGSVGGAIGFAMQLFDATATDWMRSPMIRDGGTLRFRWFGSLAGSTTVSALYNRTDYYRLVTKYEGSNEWRTEIWDSSGTLIRGINQTLNTNYLPTEIKKAGLTTYTSGTGFSSCDVDSVIIREYVSTEPSFSVAGTEETNAATSNISSMAGIAQASIKSVAGVTSANIKSIVGIANS